MNKIEKQFKKYMEDQIEVKDSFLEVAKRIDFEEGGYKMKKKLIPALGGLLTLGIVGAVVIVGLNNKPSNQIKPKGIVRVDTNPSIELVVDENNKVVSVTGLNDDGKMVIVNEEIVNKSLDDAIEIIIKVEKDTGFLISGRVGENQNEIKISVEGESEEIIKDLKNKAEQSIINICDDLKIDEKIKEVENYGREKLEERVLAIDPTLEDKVKEMTHQELLNVVRVYHLESSIIYSQELEELYLDVKEYNIEFAEKEETKEIINKMESSYQALLNIYSETIDSLKEAASSLETLKYELLIDPESAYQKALVEVNNAKAELNALKQEIANEENPSILLEAELKIKEGLLEGVILVLDNAEKVTSSTIDLTKEALEKIVVSLEEQEENFPTEIKTELTNKVKDLETKVNEAKDKSFENFENKYKDDITRIKDNVISRKQALIESLKQ